MNGMTEMSLRLKMSLCIEGDGADKRVVSVPKSVCWRGYSTEMDITNERMMQTYTTVISRNTLENTRQVYLTTCEDESKGKRRKALEYRRMIDGYLLLCSNNNPPSGHCRERAETISRVVRTVMSSAAPLMTSSRRGRHDQDPRVAGTMNMMQRVGKMSNEVAEMCEPLLWTGMGIATCAAFMQWTGNIGDLQHSPVSSDLMQVFDAQMLGSDALTRDYGLLQGDLERLKQVSKARAVSMSVIAVSLCEAAESGMLGEGQQEAIDRTAMYMRQQCTEASVVPWMIADCVDHLLRWDMVMMMQVMSADAGLRERGLQLDDLIAILRGDDVTDNNPTLRALAYLKGKSPQAHMVRAEQSDNQAAAEQMLRTLMARTCYVSCPSFTLRIPLVHGESDETRREKFLRAVAKKIMSGRHREALVNGCNLLQSRGEDILYFTLREQADRIFRWPNVFGGNTNTELPAFWNAHHLGQAPPADGDGEQDNEMDVLASKPIVVLELANNSEIMVCADARWLLLISSICGTTPSQTSRLKLVHEWVRCFYEKAVPRSMHFGEKIFTGLPGPSFMDRFMDFTSRVTEGDSSPDQALLRPLNCEISKAPVPSKLPEDMGAAANRMLLAWELGLDERALPTDCVGYSFPENMWCPVKLTIQRSDAMSLPIDEDSTDFPLETFATLRFSGTSVQLYLNDQTFNARATEEDHCFLSGRVCFDVRPLACYDRRGVLVCPRVRMGDGMPEGIPGVVYEFLPGVCRYRIRYYENRHAKNVLLDPDEMDRAIVALYAPVWIRITACEQYGELGFVQAGKNEGRRGAYADDTWLVRCTLMHPVGGMKADEIRVRLMLRESTRDYTYFKVPIRHVIACAVSFCDVPSYA